MKAHVPWLVVLLAVSAVRGAPPPASPPPPLAAPVRAALEASHYAFTPEVKASVFAQEKAEALKAITAAGHSLPADFLAWVDGNPVVAATVYGIATNPVQRLVLLRSLELDLGAVEVREKHPQLVLALTDAFAGSVDRTTLSNTNLAIRLQARDLLQLEIKRAPCVRVDTRAKDRPLDINDHIINFLEDHPVVVTNKVVRESNGQKVEEVTTHSRPLHAYEVYSHPGRVKEFNAYMTGLGFAMNLDCGNGSIVPAHWGGGRDITKAYKLFRTAYEAKGLLPGKPDPRPTPAELAAYLIRNDNHRFPEGVKRAWPKFPLNAPWPVLDFLVRGGESLREREFVWKRFCDTGSVVGYGAYIGGIAQYPDMVKARKLQPFDFTYDTYPMRLKDGGVCGTCSNVGRFSNTALGVPAAQAGQPGHSCLVSVGGSEAKGFGLSIGQSVAGPGSTTVSGRGPFVREAAKFYTINYGLGAWLDARMVLQLNARLPADTQVSQRLALLESGLALNPYSLDIATAIQGLLDSPQRQIAFWQGLEKTLAAVEKPGCPKTGYYNGLVLATLDKRLAELPIPTEKPDLDIVLAFLAGRADASWLRYQTGTAGLSPLAERMAAEVRDGVEGARTPTDTAILAKRLALVGGAMKKSAERQAWAHGVLALLDGREIFTFGEGKAAKPYTDPCVLALRELEGSTPELRAEFIAALTKSVAGTRTTASCTLLRDRLNVLVKHTAGRDRPAFANALIAVINGNDAYAPNPAKPMVLAVDPVAPVIYSLGGDLAPVKARLAADLKASVEGVRTPDACNLLNARLAAVARYAGKPDQKKAWGEELLKIVEGRESYLLANADPKKQKELPDPCAVQVYQLAGRKTPAQLKAEEARLAAEEAKRKAAQPLTTAEKARQDLSKPK